MRALADHDAVLQDHDQVAVDDRRQAVGDDHERAVGGDRIDGLAHALLVHTVERRRRFVEQQDRGVGQQRAGDRESLTLTAGEHHAVLADGSLDPEGAALEHVAEIHGAQHALAVGVGRLGRGEPQVLRESAGQRRRVLLDVAEVGAQLVARIRARVVAVQADRAARRVVEALDERQDRALAGAAGADEGDAGAVGHGEGHATEHLVVLHGGRRFLCGLQVCIREQGPGLLGCGRTGCDDVRGVVEAHVAELDGRCVGGRRLARQRRGDLLVVLRLGRQIEHFLDATERTEGLVHRGDGAERGGQGHHEQEQEHDERDQGGDRDRSGRHTEAADAEDHQQRELQGDAGDGHDHGGDLGDAHADPVGV